MTTDRGVKPMSGIYTDLPVADEHGQSATWMITDRDGTVHRIEGTFLGMGTSYRPEHKGHPGDRWAPVRTHCSTCRWTELRIFRGTDRRFHVVNCGASDVPGERDLVQVTEVETPFELVEALTSLDRRTQKTVLPMPARRALAMAASHDADARDAYVNSPVT